ncbi:methionine biosynthesis protein MetW [Halorhodospira halophila]|uniref:methionine biosynthesis protein MetW n=1 Tax=Halorhodospira TaxID=85108 RepID=UPI003CC7EDFB
MNPLRRELEIVADWIEPGSRVLDLGCGDGTLLHYLVQRKGVTAYGLEIDPRKVTRCMDRGVNVVRADLDEGLDDFHRDSFDHVIMSQTVQAVRYPDKLLEDMLRVGRHGIVTFPNIGYWRLRMQLLLKGRMPRSPALPNAWYNSPNIHLCTVRDFERLCATMGVQIRERRLLDRAHRSTPFIDLAPNLLGEVAIYRFVRGSDSL